MRAAGTLGATRPSGDARGPTSAGPAGTFGVVRAVEVDVPARPIRHPPEDAHMWTRRISCLTFAGALVLGTTDCRPRDAAAASRAPGDFRAPLGVQLWSYRAQAQADLPAALATVRRAGFTHVETAGLYGMSAPQFAQTLRAAGLHATSMHVSYDALKQHPESVIADAKGLGARYVGIAWYPHDSAGFTEANARQAVQDFNAFGRTLKAAGLTFFYHNHGYEPVPHGDGTLLDLLIQQTDPALVAFEMDVLWTWLPNQDPVGLIRKYPGRFKLMHIKDMQPGVARGSLAGGLPADQQAVIGRGQVDWPALLKVAQQDGMAEYYVEDETPDPVRNAPQSVAYLTTLRYR
ncbi:xylose isomerase [Gemmatimonadetes bacterium T265]|nr:xylose isomerase [Gemmatimonadetes bacterium T265]